VYHHLSPEASSSSNDPVIILAGRHAFLSRICDRPRKLLDEKAYRVSDSMRARNHVASRGKEGVDSHEILQIEADSKTFLLDPMANTYFPLFFWGADPAAGVGHQ